VYTKPIRVRRDKTLGYEYFCDKLHPCANNQGKVYYHRHVLSLKLGRWLLSNEHVHHADGCKWNNDPDNLELVTAEEHPALHHPAREPKLCELCGSPTKEKRFCSVGCASFSTRVVKRPSKSELRSLLRATTWTALGRRYGVSDNAVRKWAKQYGLL